jgi:hypothetical protein
MNQVATCLLVVVIQGLWMGICNFKKCVAFSYHIFSILHVSHILHVISWFNTKLQHMVWTLLKHSSTQIKGYELCNSTYMRLILKTNLEHSQMHIGYWTWEIGNFKSLKTWVQKTHKVSMRNPYLCQVHYWRWRML